MATIPIEIVLQDAESPVEPILTPEEETDIAVPETGTISNGNGGSNNGIGSAVSIILPAIIAVLAIGAMVAIIIHRYQKRKKTSNGAEECNTKESKRVVSRKEKLATVASGTIAILAATVLVGNLVIPATKAATDDTNNDDEGELIVDDKITITVTREAGSDEAIVSSIDTKSYATVYKTFGYEVAIAMAGNTANLYLDGDKSSEYYFSPVEDGTLTDNTWGYAIDGEEYAAMPLIDDLAVVTKGTTPVSNEEVDINYGVKVASDMPNGTYAGELEYILADTGFPAALRTMQDMTTDICNSVPTPNPFKADNTTIEDNVPTIMLPDSRDDKLYRIAKLADGKCWMTQNLDLQKEDLLDGVVLNDSNTDHPANSFTLPTSQTSGDTDWSGDETAYNTVHVYDPSYNETKYYYCVNYSFGPGCLEYSDEEVPLKSFSNYYNWYTATAGTGTYNLGQGEVAEGSICSAGWRLPSGGVNQAATDFSNLFYRYGMLSSPTSASEVANISALYEQPLLFLRGSGVYYHGLNGIGTSSNIWTSMAYGESYGSNSAWSLGIATTISANPWLYSAKYIGMSVRCVAR